MNKPKHGDEAKCRFCGETIKFIGGTWKHWHGPRSDDPDGYPHVAMPVSKPVETTRKGKR